MKDNATKDILDAKLLKLWSDAYLGGSTVDEYNTPLNAASVWWKDIPVSQILITVGDNEMLRDDVLQLGQRMKVLSELC